MGRPNERDERGVSVDLAREVWQRRKWLALVVFAAALAGGSTLTLSLPPLYRATASVIVERQQISEAFVRPSVTTELETRIQTIHKQVTSRARLTDVITRFNLYPELRGQAPMDAIVERMRRDIDFGLSGVEQMTGRTATIAFTLSYSGRDPFAVAEVANTLVASYVDENTKSRERQAVRTAEFLKAQLDEVKRELGTQEQRERDFTLRHTSELPQQVDVNLAALDRLNTQLRLNGEYQLRTIERRERLEHQLQDAENASAPAPPPDSRAAQILKLEQQLGELRSKFSDRYPDVIRVKAEIAALQRQQASAPADNGTNGHGATAPAGRRATEQALGQLESELASLKQEEGMLRRLIADYETRVENAPKRQEELQRLSNDYKTAKDRYETLLKRYEEAKVAESLEQGQNVEQFRVLDPAVPSMAPVAPNTFWLLGMSLVGSVALAFGAMVGAEKLDTSFHSVDELRAFAAVPTLAVIRRIPTPSAVRARRLRFALLTLAVAAGLALAAGGAYYIGSGNEQIVRMTMRGAG